MKILYAFLIGGLICSIGQLIMDNFKLLPVHITLLFVLIGALLDIGGLYDKLIEISGNGVSLPISSFGHSIVHAALEKAETFGFVGIFMGVFDKVASGIVAATFFAFLMAIIFKPKG